MTATGDRTTAEIRPGFWHRLHVGYSGMQEGFSHVFGDVAGAVAAVPGLVIDAGDLGVEVFGGDLYEGSATRDFFSNTHDFTKKYIGDSFKGMAPLPIMLIPGAGRVLSKTFKNVYREPELLDSTDRTIYNTAEIGTRIVGDTAVVVATAGIAGTAAAAGTTGATANTSALTVASTGAGVIGQGLSAAWPAVKSVATLPAVLMAHPVKTVVGAGLVGVAGVVDQYFGGYGAHALLTTAEKAIAIAGGEDTARNLDDLATIAGPDSFAAAKNEREEQAWAELQQEAIYAAAEAAAAAGGGTLTDEQLAAVRTAALTVVGDRPESAASRRMDHIEGRNVRAPIFEEGGTAADVFNWLGGQGGKGAQLAVGAGTLLVSNWILDRILGNSAMSGFLSICLGILMFFKGPDLIRQYTGQGGRAPENRDGEQAMINPGQQEMRTDMQPEPA